MFEIRAMTAADFDAVMPMVRTFYQSPAVGQGAGAAVLEGAVREAVEAAEPLLRGLLLLEDGAPVGYAYVTECYSGEVGGRCLFFEEMYFRPECRGKGYGTAVFRYLKEQYPNYPRFRLEVTDVNQNAIRLYEKLGFRFLEYRQMVLEGDLNVPSR